MKDYLQFEIIDASNRIKELNYSEDRTFRRRLDLEYFQGKKHALSDALIEFLKLEDN